MAMLFGEICLTSHSATPRRQGRLRLDHVFAGVAGDS
jgi:hypothetical protein